jgi:hypothetical protein
MNETNTNQVAAQVVKKSPGKPRTRFTKTFKVVVNDKGEFNFAFRGKPANNTVMGEVTLPFDYDKSNGVPTDAILTNKHTVVYVKKEKVAPGLQVNPTAI